MMEIKKILKNILKEQGIVDIIFRMKNEIEIAGVNIDTNDIYNDVTKKGGMYAMFCIVDYTLRTFRFGMVCPE